MEEKKRREMDLDCEDNHTKFVYCVINYPILLNNSNLPDIKNRKCKAIQEIKEKLTLDTGFSMTETQIWKKINNMKTRLKRKANQKNNKKYLKEWEEHFIQFMNMKDFSNNTNSNMKDGIPHHKIEENYVDVESNDESELFINLQDATNNSSINVTKAESCNCNFKRKESKLPETAETKDLSMSELQRLVLLEQLQTLRLAKSYFTKRKNKNNAY